jgi:glycosyltransferase involved in cell wall biosynthesis
MNDALTPDAVHSFRKTFILSLGSMETRSPSLFAQLAVHPCVRSMSAPAPFRVTHLIPYDGIGGVETAARSMKGHQSAEIDFCCHFIHAVPMTRAARLALFSPWAAFRAAQSLCAAPPDLVIVSLWRSCIAALLAKLLRPRLRVVLFLHMARDAHAVDRWLTRAMARHAIEIWADSAETGSRRLPGRSADRVIPFITARLSPARPAPLVAPHFLYWGRLHPRKDLPRALGLFAAVHRRLPDARFEIIGPDGGARARIEARIAQLGLGDAVALVGPLDQAAIARRAAGATFYLQTSREEGMAMSVVEAMQLGLVPVVTPVGEIASYCQARVNAILIGGQTGAADEAAADEVVAILADPTRLDGLRAAAISTWAEAPLYADAVLDACRAIRDAA